MPTCKRSVSGVRQGLREWAVGEQSAAWLDEATGPETRDSNTGRRSLHSGLLYAYTHGHVRAAIVSSGARTRERVQQRRSPAARRMLGAWWPPSHRGNERAATDGVRCGFHTSTKAPSRADGARSVASATTWLLVSVRSCQALRCSVRCSQAFSRRFRAAPLLARHVAAT